MKADLERCKHGMIKVTCAFCMLPDHKPSYNKGGRMDLVQLFERNRSKADLGLEDALSKDAFKEIERRDEITPLRDAFEDSAETL